MRKHHGLIMKRIIHERNLIAASRFKSRSILLTFSGLLAAFLLALLSASSARKEPLVTVILTSYNVESFIQTAIVAVLSQTYRNLEIIIVDDASTDLSLRAAKLVSENDTRVSLLSLQNNSIGGVSIPVNIALQYAKGEYVAFVDGDDILAKDAISKMVNACRRQDPEVLIFRFRTFDNSKFTPLEEYDFEYWPALDVVKESQSRPLDPVDVKHIFKLSPEPWRKFYKKSFLDHNRIQFPEGDFYFEDNSFHWMVLGRAKKISFLEDELYLHRENRKGQTTGRGPRDFTGSVHISESSKKYKELLEKNSIDKKMTLLKRAGHFLNVNVVGHFLTNCESASGKCLFARSEFLFWIYRHQWLLPLAESQGGSKCWKKFSSLYFQTLTYWRNEFQMANLSIPHRKLRVPKRVANLGVRNISLSVVLFCSDYTLQMSSLSLVVDAFKNSVEYFVLDAVMDPIFTQELSDMEANRENLHVLHFGATEYGRAVNFALSLCEGEYIYVSKGDEVLKKNILEQFVRAGLTLKTDVIVWMRSAIDVNNSALNSNSELANSKYSFNSNGARHFVWNQVPFFNERFEIKSYQPNDRIMDVDATQPMLSRRRFLLKHVIFYGGANAGGEIQFSWHLFLRAGSVSCIHGLHRENSNSGIGQLVNQVPVTEDKVRQKSFLNELLITNRLLLRNGIKRDSMFHKKWINFCSACVTKVLHTPRDGIDVIDVQGFAKLVLYRVQNSITDVIVRDRIAKVKTGKSTSFVSM